MKIKSKPQASLNNINIPTHTHTGPIGPIGLTGADGMNGRDGLNSIDCRYRGCSVSHPIENVFMAIAGANILLNTKEGVFCNEQCRCLYTANTV